MTSPITCRDPIVPKSNWLHDFQPMQLTRGFQVVTLVRLHVSFETMRGMSLVKRVLAALTCVHSTQSHVFAPVIQASRTECLLVYMASTRQE